MTAIVSSLLNRMSVKWKVLTLFCTMVGVIGILLIGLSFTLFSNYQDSVVADRAHHTSDSIVYALETMERLSQLERYVAIVGAEPDVDILLVIDLATESVLASNKGILRGGNVRSIEDANLQEDILRALSGDVPMSEINWQGDRASYTVKAPTLVLATGDIVETLVFVRLKARYITAQSSDMAQQLLIGLIVGLMLAVIMVSKFLYDLVISPLSKLRDITQSRAVDTVSMAPFTRRMDEFGELAHSILISYTEARETAEKFARQASHDSLTDLGNRTMFQERLHSCLAHAENSGKLVALMILDLDHFKEVNDTLGHHIGDQLLIKVADILRQNARDMDTVIRLGGDEFAIIVDELDQVDGVIAQANGILEALTETHVIGGHDVHIDASIGITVYPQDGRDPDVLLKNADLALYRAKEEGRGNIQLYRHELHLRVIERNAIERDLRIGINANQFVLYYQPKVDLSTGDIAGVEALIRWRHPDRGLVAPDVFIPVAEESGIICDLTDWVLTEACRQIREWMDEGVGPVSVAVNVSALDLRRPDFTDRVAATLIGAGVSPKYLEIEVTESTMMHDVDQVIGTLRRLRAFGVSISIDDFGTGYSSLAYLQRFPVQRLKIDRSFVMDMSTDVNSHAIPRLIIDLARNLGVGVLAEGVETQEQREILTTMGCEEAQGYLFGAPVPAETLESLLRRKVNFPARQLEETSDDEASSISVA